jgi:DNA-binding FadR family transcriptional regulator
LKNIPDHNNEFITYLASCANRERGRIPALAELSRELGISIASLREQMEVARALGLVEVKPRTGIRHIEYSFRPAVLQSLSYAISTQPNSFEEYSDLRNHIETAYWYQSVSLLTTADHDILRELVRQAFEKLNRTPVQIPHQEHRELHLSIYRRLNNVFVIGILEAYWDMYEAAGLDVYTDLTYLRRVWQYHEKMVEYVISGNYEAGYQAMIDHMNLLNQRPKTVSHQKFE